MFTNTDLQLLEKQLAHVEHCHPDLAALVLKLLADWKRLREAHAEGGYMRGYQDGLKQAHRAAPEARR